MYTWRHSFRPWHTTVTSHQCCRGRGNFPYNLSSTRRTIKTSIMGSLRVEWTNINNLYYCYCFLFLESYKLSISWEYFIKEPFMIRFLALRVWTGSAILRTVQAVFVTCNLRSFVRLSAHGQMKNHADAIVLLSYCYFSSLLLKYNRSYCICSF